MYVSIHSYFALDIYVCLLLGSYVENGQFVYRYSCLYQYLIYEYARFITNIYNSHCNDAVR
jgi:hypothetical protein